MTRSAIAAGDITVRGDYDANGNKISDSLASLSRDTASANGSVQNHFNLEEIRQQQEAAQIIGEVGFRVAGDVGKYFSTDAEIKKTQADEYVAQANKTADPVEKQELFDKANTLYSQANPVLNIWGEGGIGKIALHTVVGAAAAKVGGGDVLGGAMGAGVVEAARKIDISRQVFGIDPEKSFRELNDRVKSGELDPNSNEYKIALAEANKDYLYQKNLEKITNPVTSLLIGGAVSGLAGGDVMTGAGSAWAAEQYNRQLHESEKQKIKELAKEHAEKQGLTEQEAYQILLYAAWAKVRTGDELTDGAPREMTLEKRQDVENNPEKYAWATKLIDNIATQSAKAYGQWAISYKAHQYYPSPRLDPGAPPEVLFGYNPLTDRVADYKDRLAGTYAAPFYDWSIRNGVDAGAITIHRLSTDVAIVSGNGALIVGTGGVWGGVLVLSTTPQSIIALDDATTRTYGAIADENVQTALETTFGPHAQTISDTADRLSLVSAFATLGGSAYLQWMSRASAAAAAEVQTLKTLTSGGSSVAESKIGGAVANTESKIAGPPSFVTQADNAMFWSKLGKNGDVVAGDVATAQGRTTLEQYAKAKGINLPEWNANDPYIKAIWQDASRQFAQGASGEVRVVLGGTPAADSTWLTVELPALKSNPNVTKIIKLDPRTKAETVIYVPLPKK